MVAHVLSVHSNQCISDLLPSISSLFIVFFIFPVLLQLFFVFKSGWERAIKRERERKREGEVFLSAECWSAVMTERQREDYCAILSRMLSGAWKHKVTILNVNPRVITRSLSLLWSSCHARHTVAVVFWRIHIKSVQTVKYKNTCSYPCCCLVKLPSSR